MDSQVTAQVQATIEALVLKEAFAPLTKSTPLGDYAADTFATLVTKQIEHAK